MNKVKKFKTHKLIPELNKVLSEKENEFYTSEQDIPPVFIAGAPRSGTTLLYQILVSAFDIGYIDNIVAKFWEAPLFGLVLTNEVFPFGERILTSYESEYGFTKETIGPHEFGYFWKRWFEYSQTHEISKEELTKIDSENLRKVIYSMNSALNKPVAFKNAVAVTLQIKYLTEVFSNAVVLTIEREPLYNAQSILEARLGSNRPEEWFSAKPKEYVFLKEKNIYEQVIGQVYYCNERISEAKNEILHSENPSRLIEIKYEDLCEDPNKIVNTIDNYIKKFNVKRKDVTFEKFNTTNTVRLEKEIFEKLEKEYGKYY